MNTSPPGADRSRDDDSTDDLDDDSGVDFVIAAYREDGRWQVEALPPVLADDLGALIDVLRQRPSDSGALGMVAVDEDFFVLVRVAAGTFSLLLSDVTAAQDWPIAAEVLDYLDLDMPEDDDAVQPAGDVGMLADLGVPALDVAELCDDIDSFPDETLSQLAEQLGFGDAFEQVLDTVVP